MPEQEFPYIDDPSIGNDAPLWRRIPPCHFVFDENRGAWRPSSAAFQDHPNGTPMSVVLGQEVLDAGRTADSVLEGHNGFGLVSFMAWLARRQKQGIMRKPLLEEPAHAEVFGKKTHAVKKAFCGNCQWIVLPPGNPV
jgi:hypothetical protein